MQPLVWEHSCHRKRHVFLVALSTILTVLLVTRRQKAPPGSRSRDTGTGARFYT